MKVNTDTQSKGLVSLISDHCQLITVDANILIPPDRTKICDKVPPFSFDHLKEYWLDPMLNSFPHIAVHEAVLEELQSSVVLESTMHHIDSSPPRIRVLTDSIFYDHEELFRQKLEQTISCHTAYDPTLDNKDDRGEVKSLAHIGTRGYLFFCSHDSNALRLVEQAEYLKTNLDNVNAIQPYEIIYYLYKMDIGDREGLRMLYKYMYHLTKREKATNPNWVNFLHQMDILYSDLFNETRLS